jgi:uncharacterized membrane protein YbaN (DUF454 family)
MHLRGLFRNQRVVAVLRLTLGWFCVLLGILGLFLPVLQGLVFLVLGMALLAPYIPFLARLRRRLYRRFPRTQQFVLRMKRRVHRWSGGHLGTSGECPRPEGNGTAVPPT